MERAFISHLRERLPTNENVVVGPGDDAAVLKLFDDANIVVTVDALTDGVDFALSEVDASRIGHKALAVNFSDLAAMAARPVAAFVSLVLPKFEGDRIARQLYDGILPLADRFGVAIAGGDTNSWDGPLAIAITALGETTPRGPLTRGGARPGDALLVTGSLGGSILGKHLDFTPRVEEAIFLHQRHALTAGIDISDGLSRDLHHLCHESGCGAMLRLDSIPIADAARTLAANETSSKTAVEHALSDGEDFELLFAAPEAVAETILREQPLDVPISLIGQFTNRNEVIALAADGTQTTLPNTGWEHRI
jgi:thiamine-monophosphate kinase